MIGETHHRDHYPTLFKEWQGVFYGQCPIGRAPHTMAFGNSVMDALRERSGITKAMPGFTPQSADCEATTLPLCYPDTPFKQSESNEVCWFKLSPKGSVMRKTLILEINAKTVEKIKCLGICV